MKVHMRNLFLSTTIIAQMLQLKKMWKADKKVWNSYS